MCWFDFGVECLKMAPQTCFVVGDSQEQFPPSIVLLLGDFRVEALTSLASLPRLLFLPH